MTPICMSKLRTTIINASVGVVSTTTKQNGACADLETYVPITETHSQKNPISIQQEKNNAYLNIETIQKMIWRFLSEKQISKEKLAEALGITVKSLKQICSKKAPAALMLQINLPLIKLYCKTKF